MAYKEEVTPTTCAHCGKVYEASEYSLLCDAIMSHKPACGLECNRALGQVYNNPLTRSRRDRRPQ